MKKDRTKKRRRLPDDEPKRKSKSASKMAEWKEQWDGDDDEKGDERYDTLKVGKNTRRILPNRDPDEPWFEAYAMHFNMGPDGQDSFRCVEPGGPFGHSKKLDKKRNYRAKKCPACKKYCRMKTSARKFEFGSKAGISFWRENVAPWRAKHQFLMAVTKPKSKTEKRKPFILKVGLQIAKPLMEAYFDEDGGGDFTDPVRGRNIVIKKEQLSKRSQDIKYTVNIQPDRTKIDNWKKLGKKLPDLKSFLPEELDPEAIQAIIDGDGEDGDDDETPRRRKKSAKGRFKSRDGGDSDLDDDVDADEDDDEEESARKLKLRKRRRDEDEDVDPDADEEDDDEEETPKKKKKKSKMREKLARRAEQDDDDDDADDADDEDDEDLDDDDEDLDDADEDEDDDD